MKWNGRIKFIVKLVEFPKKKKNRRIFQINKNCGIFFFLRDRFFAPYLE